MSDVHATDALALSPMMLLHFGKFPTDMVAKKTKLAMLGQLFFCNGFLTTIVVLYFKLFCLA